MKTIYLAGPITDQTVIEANDWRIAAINRLHKMGYRGISPLRCEPVTGKTYKLFYDDPCFGTPRAIAGKNYYDVRNCDFILAYCPSVSVGTILEIGWAFGLGKPVIVVSTLDGVANHPLIHASTNWVVPDLEHAYKIIDGVLNDYTDDPHNSSPNSAANTIQSTDTTGGTTRLVRKSIGAGSAG